MDFAMVEFSFPLPADGVTNTTGMVGDIVAFLKVKAYQRIVGGHVTEYLNADGERMFVDPPPGVNCRVLETFVPGNKFPPRLPWMA